MSASGQLPGTFTIEALPVGIDFQVILESTVRVLCLEGIERGYGSMCVISKPISLPESFDAPNVFITEWVSSEKQVFKLSSPENCSVDNQQHAAFQRKQFSSLNDVSTFRNDEDSQNGAEQIKNYIGGNDLWKTVSIKFSVNDIESKDSILTTNINSSNETFEAVQENDSGVSVSEELPEVVVDSEPDNKYSPEKDGRKTRSSGSFLHNKRNRRDTPSKRKSVALKCDKRPRHSKRNKDDKLCYRTKRKKLNDIKDHDEETDIEESNSNHNNIVLSKNDGQDSDRESGNISTGNSSTHDTEVKPVVRSRTIPPKSRKRSARSKSLKGQTVKRKKSKNKEDLEIDTEGIDPKLIYAKKSLEKQNLRNAKRIRVELENYTDRFRTTVVESLAQRDRGKSFEEKSYQSYECAICGRFQTTVEERIRYHIEQHVNGELECKKCGYILSYSKEISRHNSEAHPTNVVNKTMCELCGKTADSYRMWKAHMSKVHKVPSFKCKHCPEKFFNATEVVVHTKETHKDVIMPCDKCGQIFVSRSNWSYHSVRCNGTANSGTFVCDQCGKDLSTAIALRRHIRHNHEMEKTHKCTLCSYATPTIARLQKHMNAHLGKKQYHCEVCQFSCVQKYQLTSHMRTHSGEKPFRCDQCPYAVAWNVQLKTHKKIHSLPYFVTCSACGIVFRDVKSLSKHELKDHGTKGKIDKPSVISVKPVSNTLDNNADSSTMDNSINRSVNSGVNSNVISNVNSNVISNVNNCVNSKVNSCVNSDASILANSNVSIIINSNVHNSLNTNVNSRFNGNVSGAVSMNQHSMYNNPMRNVNNSFHMDGILPSGSGMNMNSDIRNHLHRLENPTIQGQEGTQVPMYSFSTCTLYNSSNTD